MVKLPDFSTEDIQKLSTDDIVRLTKKNLSHLSRLESFLYVRPLFKVPLFVGGFFLFRVLLGFIFPWDSLLFSNISILLMLFMNAYLLFFMVFLVRHSFKHLVSAKNLGSLFFGYVFFMVSILLVFSSAYASVERMDKGYLTYGACGDGFDPSIINSDPGVSHNYFYFSTITLFTVGYGDICPMGLAKGVAIANAFIGNFITVVVMVIVISAYMKRSEN